MGLGFNRLAIINAYVVFAHANAGGDALGQAAWRARTARFEQGTATVAYWRLTDGTSQHEAIDELDEKDRPHYFALLAAKLGIAEAEKIENDYTRAHKTDGVTVVVSTNEEDPFRIDFYVSDPIACQWADHDQTIAGASWEGTGDEGLAYASTYWHGDLIAELEKEGYDLNLSQYCEPSEEDLRIADHQHSCEACEHRGEFRHAAKHVEEIDAAHAEAIELEEERVEAAKELADAIALEQFARALMVVSHVAVWESPTLFPQLVVYPRRWKRYGVQGPIARGPAYL
jgi:hypothetical protein